MKGADIEVSKVYAVGRFGGGPYDRRSALLARVIGPDVIASGFRKPLTGWRVERVEGEPVGEQFVIPSRNFFHDEATERANRAVRDSQLAEHAARMAEGKRLAESLGGGTVRSVVGSFTISLTAEQARALVARLDATGAA